jgi:hypothetical protein
MATSQGSPFTTRQNRRRGLRVQRNTGTSEDAMTDGQTAAADCTAVRVASWRAMYVLDDLPPHVLEDGNGLQLAKPEDGWRSRGDMHPSGTSRFRAAIVARADDLSPSGGEDLLVLVPDAGT